MGVGKTDPMRIARLLRRRRWLASGGWIVLLLLLVSAAADQLGLLGKSGSDWEQFDRQSFFVSHVMDGDTIEIATLRGPTAVRLIGIDAPELRRKETSAQDHWAEPALKYTRARCQGKMITIKLDQTQTRDRYGRLLAYIYLSDTDMLNLDIIRDGQAYAERRFKHTFRPQFEMAENEARKKGRGLWKNVTEDQMPPWRREWLRQMQMRP